MQEIIKEIFDYVYDELEISDMYEVEKILEKDSEYKTYYLKLKDEKDGMLSKDSLFKNVQDDFLEEQRDILFNSLRSDKDVNDNNNNDDDSDENNIVKFNINKNKLYRFSTEFVKYAAVILITFFIADMSFNNPNTSNGFTSNNDSGINNINSTYPNNIIQPVSFDNNNNKSLMDGFKNSSDLKTDGADYNIKNLSVDQDGANITLDFDISTHKTVTGKRNDPIIEYTLDQIMKNEKNLGIKLRTIKAIGKTNNSKLQATLIEVMLNQKEDMIIRKKAMKMLVKNAISPEIENALVEIVKSESDQAFRIEALNTLENIDTKIANSSLKEINSTDEYLKYKASIADGE